MPQRARTRRRRALCPLAATLVAALVALMPAAATAQTEPEVLERDPYYLGLFEARGEHQGTVLLMHGGGWRGDLGPGADDVMGDWISMLQRWGYDVANLGYRGGSESLTDALDAFDLLRDERGPDERICIVGASAGAQLALTVAAERGNSVDCVVDLLGPPDLVEWGNRPLSDEGLRLARRAFGEERLAELSPINLVDRIVSPVLVVAAPCDAFIELSAQRRFARALEVAGVEATLNVVATGDDIPLGHCAVENRSYRRFQDVARAFLAGRSDEIAVPETDDSGFDAFLVLAAAVVLGGLALLFWSLRRRA